MSSGKRKNKSQVYKKKNGSKETITQNTNDDRNKTNLQQHKKVEPDSRKSNKISRDFFKLHKRKCQEETIRNIKSSTERLDITNNK